MIRAINTDKTKDEGYGMQLHKKEAVDAAQEGGEGAIAFEQGQYNEEGDTQTGTLTRGHGTHKMKRATDWPPVFLARTIR